MLVDSTGVCVALVASRNLSAARQYVREIVQRYRTCRLFDGWLTACSATPLSLILLASVLSAWGVNLLPSLGADVPLKA